MEHARACITKIRTGDSVQPTLTSKLDGDSPRYGGFDRLKHSESMGIPKDWDETLPSEPNPSDPQR